MARPVLSSNNELLRSASAGLFFSVPGGYNVPMANLSKRTLTALFTAAGALTAAAAAGLPWKTDITEYEISSKSIPSAVRILVLSDLHNDYGSSAIEKLTRKVIQLKPDLILMPGDIAEEHHHQERTFEFLSYLKGIPMYYCTGNHEEFRWDLSELKQRFREFGLEVLDEKSLVKEVNGTPLEIAGISCRLNETSFTAQEVNDLFHTDHYRILLSHKPNWINLYRKVTCDLVVCGHAHGGQWHIPVADIPLAAPSQGLFPKYTSGIHDLGGVKMLVSRGMVRHYHGIPRLYNNPEIVVLTLKPE